MKRRKRYPGRKRIPDRQLLTGILFVLKTGIPWGDLPQEMGCGSGVTCWRRLAEWQEQGVWDGLHEALLAKLHGAGEIDWERAAIDSSHVRAFLGGERTGPSPVDRRKRGSKHHLITCGRGSPLAAKTTAANVNDAPSSSRSSMRCRRCADVAADLGEGRGTSTATRIPLACLTA